jgi:hypothetical protein
MNETKKPSARVDLKPLSLLGFRHLSSFQGRDKDRSESAIELFNKYDETPLSPDKN